MYSHRVTGIVQSGRGEGAVPLTGAFVTLFQAGDHPVDAIWSTRTDDGGRFTLQGLRPTCDGIFYVTAGMPGGFVLLRVIIGPNLIESITLNELTTVAAAYSMAHLTTLSQTSGNPLALRDAWERSENLVSPHTGAESEVLLAAGDGDATLRTLRSLGNLVAACARHRDGVRALLELTEPWDMDEWANDTFGALVNLARDPAHNAAGIFALTQPETVYEPALQQVPDAWTLAPR